MSIFKVIAFLCALVLASCKLCAGTDFAWKKHLSSKSATANIESDGTLVIDGDVGDNSAYFASAPLKLDADKAYVLDFSVMGNSAGGSIVSGTYTVNKDIGQIGGFYKDCEVLFATSQSPSDAERTIKLGGWRTNSTLKFKNVKVRRYVPLYKGTKYALGTSELMKDGFYEYVSEWSSKGFPLKPKPFKINSPFFNSNRWSIWGGTGVVFPFEVKNKKQLDAEIEIGICYNPSSQNLKISASADGGDFCDVGIIGAESATKLKFPQSLFPCSRLDVKIIAEGNGTIQFSRLKYRARIDGEHVNFNGDIYGAAKIDLSDTVKLDESHWKPSSKKIVFNILGEEKSPLNFEVDISNIDGKTWREKFRVVPRGESATAEIEIPFPLKDILTLNISLKEKNWQMLYEAKKSSGAILIFDKSGLVLPCDIDGLNVWQSSTSNRLSRDCRVPKGAANSVNLAAAKNECEAAQIVFAAKDKDRKIALKINPLVNLDGKSSLSAENIEAFILDYVPISTPTDALGERTDWPDPMLPLKDSFVLKAKKIQPVWIRVKVPSGAKAGIYKGAIEIECDGKLSQLPIELEVFNFELPQTPTVRSGFDAATWDIESYFKNRKASREHIFKQFRGKMADAKLCTYNRQYTAPKYKLEYPQGDKTKLPKVVFDWSDFDEMVRRHIKEYNVNSMVLRVSGIGGGTFHERFAGSIGEIKDGDPRYDAVMQDYLGQINSHIVANGWQNIFYTYTFDEPEKKDYEFVKRELAKIKKYAPDIKIMLTEEPVEDFFGLVDIWCPVSSNFNLEECAKRRAKGEEIWWYLCTQPRQPYAGLFIDHPGIDLRLWLWQSFKYGVDGILIWSATYMHSNTAYPNSLQNPYEDPMSWASGYGLPKGSKSDWGNGDGRLFYPPESMKRGELAADGAEIIPSVRLEMLRDGIDDYEYLTILRKMLKSPNISIDAKKRAEFENLLVIPDTITRSMTEYSFDAKYLEAHRYLVAKAIEKIIESDSNLKNKQ